MLLNAVKNLSPKGMFKRLISNTLNSYQAVDFSNFTHWELDYLDPININTM